MEEIIEFILSLVFFSIAVILSYKYNQLKGKDYIIKNKHLSLFIDRFKSKKDRPLYPTYEYDFGDGWFGSHRSNSKYYDSFGAMPVIDLYYNHRLHAKIDKYRQIKIGEKKIVLFSYYKGEEPKCITNDHNGGEIGLLFKDNEFYPKTEIKEKFINDTSKNDYETVSINGQLLKRRLDLKKTKRLIRYKPIYKNEKKEHLEIFTEIYEIINYYEEKERSC